MTSDRSLHLSVPWFSPLQSVLPESPLTAVTVHPREEVVSGGAVQHEAVSPVIAQVLGSSGKGGTG